MPLHRRIPKRGFTNIFKEEFAIVNLSDLDRFEAGSTVNEDALRSAGLVKGRRRKIKILGNGEVSKKLNVTADKFSKSAKAKIEAAGGACQEIQ